MDKLAYSITEGVEVTGICRSAFYDMIRSGRIKARKYGTRTVILAEDLEAFLKSLPEMSAQ